MWPMIVAPGQLTQLKDASACSEEIAKGVRCYFMEEGRKRVLGIIAGILVARHLNSADDLFDNRPSPRTESMVAAAVQWAERIMRKIDGVYAGK
jgi:hypothetical protein